MKIKILAIGSSKWERFIRRWGVSFLVGEDVLFDTFGKPSVLLNNMQKFNVDIAKIKHIILSHEDWDHITGLWNLLPNRKDITVHICPGFSKDLKDRIASYGVKLVETKEVMCIKKYIYTTGELPGESQGQKIYEQALVIKIDCGLSIICGCAHPGAVNIVRHVKESFHGDVYSLIGGLHLKVNTEEENMRIIKNLQSLGVKKIAPMHCTGKSATKAMREAFGQGFLQTKEGNNIEL